MSRPLCQCGNLRKKAGISSKGEQLYKASCSSCEKKKYGYDRGQYRKYKKNCCERCGFIPEHPCQLDVDHKDGNKQNNSTDNFETLCANCHRLKTHLCKDYM